MSSMHMISAAAQLAGSMPLPPFDTLFADIPEMCISQVSSGVAHPVKTHVPAQEENHLDTEVVLTSTCIVHVVVKK